MPYKDPEAKKAWRRANRDSERASRKKYRDSGKEAETAKAAKARKESEMTPFELAFGHIWSFYQPALRRAISPWGREEREASQKLRQAEKDRGRKRSGKTTKETRAAKRHRYEAKVNGNGGSYTADDIKRLADEQGGLCAYCDSPWDHVDHKHPVSRGGTSWPENLQLLCAFHNASKGAMTDGEYRAYMRITLAA